jgi:hypothetical protein
MAEQGVKCHGVTSLRQCVCESGSYVGTPLKYNCSVFGSPVALAARCAGVKPDVEGMFSSYMAFPADDWGDRDFATVFPPKKYKEPDGSIVETPHAWELLSRHLVDFKNLGPTPVRRL